MRVFGEEVEAYEDVHDGGEAADGGSGGGGYFGDGLGAAVEDVEDAVADGGFEDEGGDVAPGELHDAFGRDGRGRRCGHGFPFGLVRCGCGVSVSVWDERKVGV